MSSIEQTREEVLSELNALRTRETELSELKTSMEEERVLLNVLLQELPDRIYFKDKDCRFVRVSKALAKEYGLDNPEEVVGKTDFDFFTKEHAQHTYDDEKRVMETGEPLCVQSAKEEWPDGRVNWVTTIKMPWRNEEGEVVGTFGITRDITNIKEAEQAVRDSEALYHSLTENIPHCVFVKDREGKLKYVNKAYCETSGKPQEELVGKTDYDLYPEDLAEKYRADDFHVMETGQRIEAVEEHHPPGKESIYVQVIKTPLYDTEGNIAGVQGVFWDVTDRKRAEETLEQLAAIIRSTDDAIYGTNLEGIILTWNLGAERIYGYEPSEIIGKHVRELRAEGYREEVEAIIERIAHGEHLENYETVHLTKDGREIDVSLTTSPLRGGSGQLLGLAVISRDITRTKKNRAAMRELAAIVECSNEAIVGNTLQGIVTIWNPAAEKLYGYSAEEMVGQPFTRLVPDEFKEEELALMGRIARGEHIEGARMEHLTKSGLRLPVIIAASPIQEPRFERVTGISLILRPAEEGSG